MKLNPGKCHLLVSGPKFENVWAQIENVALSVDEYITSLSMKAGKKLSILARSSNFMCANKKRVLMKEFIGSQLDCCPLI